MAERPDVPVVPLREAAALLGYDDTPRGRRAAESALRHANVKSGYPLALVEWLRDNRPGQGARTDKEQTVKRYEIRFVNSGGRIVDTEQYDDIDAARSRERETRRLGPAGTGWTITASRRTGGESERAGLHA